MSNYVKTVNFAVKDSLLHGDPAKVVKGSELDNEFNNLATMSATKADNSAAAITGGTINGTTIGNTVPAAGTFTTLNSTAGALNGTIGATTPAAGTFTTLRATSTSQFDGNTTVGTGAGAPRFAINGGSGSGDGPWIALQKGGVNTILIGSQSAVIGGSASNDLTLYSTAGPIRF